MGSGSGLAPFAVRGAGGWVARIVFQLFGDQLTSSRQRRVKGRTMADYTCSYMPDPKSGDICGAEARWTVHVPCGGYMPVCDEHVVEFQRRRDQIGDRRKGRKHGSGKRFQIELLEDTRNRMEQQMEMQTAPVTISRGMSMPEAYHGRDNSAVCEKPEPEAKEGLLQPPPVDGGSEEV